MKNRENIQVIDEDRPEITSSLWWKYWSFIAGMKDWKSAEWWECTVQCAGDNENDWQVHKDGYQEKTIRIRLKKWTENVWSRVLPKRISGSWLA